MISTGIERLLAERIGFHAGTVGPSAVANAIARAMAESGVPDAAAYSRLVLHDAAAWEALVDHVVVPETSFFRDGVPFELVPEIASERRQREPGGVLRLLSCPCSTGEEAYSLVLALLDGGAPAGSFLVRGVDVSGRAIRMARAACFPANSFRGADLSYRDRYFARADEGAWRLGEPAASMASVEQGNILAPDFLAAEAPFDVVFCRNLLIYLHAGARAAIMATLRRLLAPDGVLIVGHAEAAIAREYGFAATGRPGAFAFTLEGARRPSTPAFVPRPVSIAAAPALPRVRVKPSPSPVADRTDVSPEALLARALELADAGHIQDALRACTAHLERLPDSADGHFLMGVLRDVMGERRLAALSLKKALYLDPGHLAALRHLALEREASGDHPGAALLRARARRASELSGGK